MQEKKVFISSELLFTTITELLADHRQAVFTVTGMSMWPFLCHGRDQVVIETVKHTQLKKGDIILFRISKEKYLLHRITRLNASSFETTGDNNCYRDGIFPFDCIVARVTQLVRKGKTISCKNPFYTISFQIWILLFPVRPFLITVWQHIRKCFISF